MILWLNGAFGSGKTQTAYAIHRRLPGSMVYDPEKLGYLLQAAMPPSLRLQDFQDHPLWRSMNRELLETLAASYPGVIIVPMTIVKRDYYEELVAALGERFPLRHFILTAPRETLLRRLRSRLEGRGSWAARQLDRCLTAYARDILETPIDTDGRSVEAVAQAVAQAAGLVLEPPPGPIRGLLARMAVTLRHIR